MRKLCNLIVASALTLAGNVAVADQSVVGKVITTQGHINPTCRTVILKESGTGTQRAFRLADPNGAPDSIAAVALAAVVSQLDVSIVFDPAQTSGCGAEPKILYITISSPS